MAPYIRRHCVRYFAHSRVFTVQTSKYCAAKCIFKHESVEGTWQLFILTFTIVQTFSSAEWRNLKRHDLHSNFLNESVTGTCLYSTFFGGNC